MKIQEIEKAQEKWGKGIVKIGELKDSLKECRMFTIDFIYNHWIGNQKHGSVIFF